MKQLLLPIILSLVLNILGTKAMAYDFAEKNSDGVTIYYTYINEGKELSVTYKEWKKACYSGTVVIPEEVTFMNRTRKVTSIGDYAFYNCSNLSSVTIPSSVSSIGEIAFYNCTSLSMTKIPDNIINIGKEAFEGCEKLKSIELPKRIKIINFATFYDCTALKSITIPDSVTIIEDRAFYNCSSLTSITLPSSLTTIEDQAFNDCDIIEVISKNENPSMIGVKSFSQNTFYNATLYVPEGSIDIYKSVSGWKKFSFIEEGMPSNSKK